LNVEMRQVCVLLSTSATEMPPCAAIIWLLHEPQILRKADLFSLPIPTSTALHRNSTSILWLQCTIQKTISQEL